jgi:hypothetical protein
VKRVLAELVRVGKAVAWMEAMPVSDVAGAAGDRECADKKDRPALRRSGGDP